MGSIADKLTYLQETKTAIKNAIIAKGVTVNDTDTFRSYADKVASIEGGGAPVYPNLVFEKSDNYTYGYQIVGSGVVVDNNGLASNFTETSYIDTNVYYTAEMFEDLEVYCEFSDTPSSICGLFGVLGTVDSYTPFYVESGSLVCWISSNGTSWDIADRTHTNISSRKLCKASVKLIEGTYNYTWSIVDIFNDNDIKKTLTSSNHPYTGNNAECKAIIGNNRGTSRPYAGKINLNNCFIVSKGKVLWEAIKGSHTR